MVATCGLVFFVAGGELSSSCLSDIRFVTARAS